MTLEVIPAEQYSMQELTDLYNQTRVDYLVPMPMNAERLAEYVRDFDIDMQGSGVARNEEGQVTGLGMLGRRSKIAWITRLGVLPVIRRMGTGTALMDFMLSRADEMSLETHLEVIVILTANLI